MHSNFRSFAFDEPFANGNFRHIPRACTCRGGGADYSAIRFRAFGPDAGACRRFCAFASKRGFAVFNRGIRIFRTFGMPFLPIRYTGNRRRVYAFVCAFQCGIRRRRVLFCRGGDRLRCRCRAAESSQRKNTLFLPRRCRHNARRFPAPKPCYAAEICFRRNELHKRKRKRGARADKRY